MWADESVKAVSRFYVGMWLHAASPRCWYAYVSLSSVHFPQLIYFTMERSLPLCHFLIPSLPPPYITIGTFLVTCSTTQKGVIKGLMRGKAGGSMLLSGCFCAVCGWCQMMSPGQHPNTRSLGTEEVRQSPSASLILVHHRGRNDPQLAFLLPTLKFQKPECLMA